MRDLLTIAKFLVSYYKFRWKFNGERQVGCMFASVINVYIRLESMWVP